MSAAILVYFKDSKLPTVDEWNAAIKAEGFDLVLDPFDPRTDSCYRPAILNGRGSGFEWYFNALTAEDKTELSDMPQIVDCDCLASLHYTSMADEDVATSIAAAVLAKLTGGFYLDTDRGNDLFDGPAALDVAREAVAEWQLRGPWNPEEKSSNQKPPIIATVPPPLPLLSGAKPPPVPANLPPPAHISKMLRYYRLSCGFFALMWLGFVISFILIARGIIDPPLSLFEEFSTANDPAARAEAIAEERQNSVGTDLMSACIAIFYAAAAFTPRKPYGWTIGLIAIIGTFLPFFIPLLLMVPMLRFWIKPETKRFFSKPI